MLEVWGRASSINVQKVMWTIGELNLPHERHDVGGKYGGLDTPAFAAMNPNRRIPVIDDRGVVVWESNAIVRYLAAAYGTGTLWHEDPAERAVADQWMDWMQTTLSPDLNATFWGLVRTPPSKRDMPAIEAAVERLSAQYSLLDRALGGRQFLLGQRLTMADIPLGATCFRYYAMEISRPRLSHVEAWYQRLQERPPYRQHVMVSFEELRATGG